MRLVITFAGLVASCGVVFSADLDEVTGPAFAGYALAAQSQCSFDLTAEGDRQFALWQSLYDPDLDKWLATTDGLTEDELRQLCYTIELALRMEFPGTLPPIAAPVGPPPVNATPG